MAERARGRGAARASCAVRALLATGVLALSIAAHGEAQAPPPVEVRLEGVFGNDALLGDGYAPIAITLRNPTRQTFRGRVVLETEEWGQPPDRHALAIDLPPGAFRRAMLTVFVGAGGASLSARYEVDGARLGATSVAATYSPGGRSLVIVSDPPRLRSSLLDLQVAVPDPNAGHGYGATATGSERAIAVPIGIVSLDGATGDPIVPDDALGWSTVAVAVASIPLLARLPARELEALRDWAHAGGHLVLVPRTEADVASPLVRELLGEITAVPGRTAVPGVFVPNGTHPVLACGERARSEPFGCASRVGHGAVHLVAYDLTAPPAVDQPATRQLLGAITQRAMREIGSPRLPLGRGRDVIDDSWGAASRGFPRVRAALDPNEGYRPALGLVAVVLLFYVVLVGPLNFRFVLGRNRPTLALITTPLAALGCALLMLAVGYLGKGVLTRYRRIEVIEAIEGSALAPVRSYSGLFLTRPAAIDLEMPERARTMRIASGGDDGLVTDHSGERARLTQIHGGLWETVFVRTDGMIDLGGAIAFHTEGRALVSVTNHGTRALRSALLIDESNVYAIGDVEVGATQPIARVASSSVTLTASPYYEDPNDRSPAVLARQLGLESADDPAVRALVRMLAATVDPAPAPVLWARIDPGDPPTVTPAFAEDSDLRLLLVRVAAPYQPLGQAMPIPVDPGSIFGEPPLQTLPPPVELAPPNDPAGVSEQEIAP
jgi:hypothetical protein